MPGSTNEGSHTIRRSIIWTKDSKKDTDRCSPVQVASGYNQENSTSAPAAAAVHKNGGKLGSPLADEIERLKVTSSAKASPASESRLPAIMDDQPSTSEPSLGICSSSIPVGLHATQNSDKSQNPINTTSELSAISQGCLPLKGRGGSSRRGLLYLGLASLL